MFHTMMLVGLALGAANATSLRPEMMVRVFEGEIEVSYLVGAGETYRLLEYGLGEAQEIDSRTKRIAGREVECRETLRSVGPMTPAFSHEHSCSFRITKNGEALPGAHLERDLPRKTAYGHISAFEGTSTVDLRVSGNAASEIDLFLRKEKVERQDIDCRRSTQGDSKSMICELSFNEVGALAAPVPSILDELKGRLSAKLAQIRRADDGLGLESVDAKRSSVLVDIDARRVSLRLYDRSSECPANANCLVSAIRFIDATLVSAHEGSCGTLIYVARQDDRPADGALREITVVDSSRFYQNCMSVGIVPATTVRYRVLTSGMGEKPERMSAELIGQKLTKK